MQSERILKASNAQFFTDWDNVPEMDRQLSLQDAFLYERIGDLARIGLTLEGYETAVEVWLRKTHPEFMHICMKIPGTGDPPAIGYGKVSLVSKTLICGEFSLYRAVNPEKLIIRDLDLGYVAGMWGIFTGDFHRPWDTKI